MGEWTTEEPARGYAVAQFPWTDTYLVVQASAGRVESLISPIRDAIGRIDRNVPVRRERTLSDLAALTTAPHRFRAVMVTTFAALALALAMVGIFGVLAYSVEQRTREFGVRMALGASTANVLKLVLSGAARVIAIGAVIGLTAAAALGQAISTFLFGVQPMIPDVCIRRGRALLTAAAATLFRPCAVRVDPVSALRTD
jgi:putative ABC transport system permease protein